MLSLCSGDQSSRLQIQGFRVRFPALPDVLNSGSVGEEALSLVRINEELLKGKVAASV
jgi:hypothetical protein